MEDRVLVVSKLYSVKRERYRSSLFTRLVFFTYYFSWNQVELRDVQSGLKSTERLRTGEAIESKSGR